MKKRSNVLNYKRCFALLLAPEICLNLEAFSLEVIILAFAWSCTALLPH